MANYLLCGREVDLADKPTPSQLADVLRKHWPQVWQQFFTHQIEAPEGYANMTLPAVSFSIATINGFLRRADKVVNAGIVAKICQQYDFPTRYISANLFKALQRTKPPDITWADLHMPFDGVIFMFPPGALYESPSRQPIRFVAVARSTRKFLLQMNTDIRSAQPDPDIDRMMLFWAVENGIVFQDVCWPVTQKLTPDVDWLRDRTEALHDVNGYAEFPDAPESPFTSYLAGLIANFLLVMEARPELTEQGEKTGQRLPKQNNIPIWRPTWVGHKYEILRKGIPTGAHFTELRWHPGYIRWNQHYGPKGSLTKIKLIDPYICYGAGLVKPETEKEIENARTHGN